MKKSHKYRSSFSAQIKPIVSSDVDKYLAMASEVNFKKYLPKDINFNEKIDFLGIAGEAFIANKLNLNDDGVSTEEAIRLKELFPLSFIDADHHKKSIIGVVVNASYAEFGTGKELTLDEVKSTKSPFTVVLGGIIWKMPNPELSDAIEASSNPSSEFYNKFFISWEVLFSDAKLIIMDKNKSNFEDGKIISDASEIERLENKLKAFGGNGYTEDGKRIGRIIIGDCIPTAIGIVEHPAGQVLPISIAKDINKSKSSYICPECDEESDMEDSMDEETEYSCAKCGKKSMGNKWKSKANIKNKDKISQNSNSQLKNMNVTNSKDIIKSNKSMITKIKDITDEVLKEATASEIIKAHKIDLDAEVTRISQEFEEKKNKVDTELKASNEKSTKLEGELNITKEQLTKVQEDLNKLVKAAADKAAEDIFSARMNYFDAEFDLDEKSKNAIANRIKNLDDAAYKQEKEDLEVLLAAKKKSGKVFDKKTMKWVDPEEKTEKVDNKTEEKKETKASVEDKTSETVIDDAIDKGTKVAASVAATTTVTETQAQKFAKAFGKDAWVVNPNVVRK